MHPDPKKTDSSLRGNESQRRQRSVHKVRLGELSSLTEEEISTMVATGDIELLVRRSDIADDSEGGWSHRINRLFERVATSLDGAPEHENRTIIVNIVASGAGHGHH
ncbi:MAG TPA: hypothetical protein VF168_06885 [Trueperaceae bacterium]